MLIRGVDLGVSVVGSGKPFIWGHGLTFSRAFEDDAGLFDWSELTNRLKVIRYDARGHGLSGASYHWEDYRWASLAEDMLGIADAIGADRFIAGGASMGCGTSLNAAIQAPDRIEALILVIPPILWEARAAQEEIFSGLFDLFEKEGIPALEAMLRERPLLPTFMRKAMPDLDGIYFSNLRKMDGKAISHLFLGAGRSNIPGREEIRKLTMPALILGWYDDPIHPEISSRQLHELLPNSTLHMAKDLNEIRAWHEQIQTFLKGL